MVLRVFRSREALSRPRQGAVDVVVLAGAAALLYVLVRVSHGLDVPFDPATAPSRISTDPAELPYYAARSLLRMFVALALSVLFTVVYATAAARLRRADRVLLPVLDILQSVPTPRVPVDHGDRVPRPVHRLRAGPGVRVDLRDLHLAGLGHGWSGTA